MLCDWIIQNTDTLWGIYTIFYNMLWIYDLWLNCSQYFILYNTNFKVWIFSNRYFFVWRRYLGTHKIVYYIIFVLFQLSTSLEQFIVEGYDYVLTLELIFISSIKSDNNIIESRDMYIHVPLAITQLATRFRCFICCTKLCNEINHMTFGNKVYKSLNKLTLDLRLD